MHDYHLRLCQLKMKTLDSGVDRAYTSVCAKASWIWEVDV